MRRSGSSSCMLRPKSSVENLDATDQLSVTVMNTQMLPTYSTERYYMLSEIEQHAHSTQFLSDFDDCDKTSDTVESSESYDPSARLPPFVLLYLLWRPGSFSSAKSFVQGPVRDSVKALQNHVDVSCSDLEPPSPSSLQREDAAAEKKTRVYLVVDMVVPYEGSDQDDNIGARERHYQVQVKIAEQLARSVAESESLRSLLVGTTVGLSDHPRAAPGLESCMEAISFGSRDRRKRKEAKSCIGIVCQIPEDMLGVDEQAETDAAQGLLQSRTCAEWNGNGNIQSFARDAHTYWRVQNNVPETRDAVAVRRSPRRRRRHAPETDNNRMDAEQLSTWMVRIFAVVLISYIWKRFGDDARNLLTEMLKSETREQDEDS